jgi:dipeptidyl aminopeptidase/acylaminoacyl peptidase
VKRITALTDAQTEPGPDAQPGDLLDAIAPLGQTAWSPDGKTLAFIWSQAGPSADLFSYDIASSKITRLTDGPSQAYSPSWSPDGRYVLQLGAPGFGTGAGHKVDGVWAAAADNSGVKLLYKPDSGEENLLGWPGPETFEVSSFYVSCSNGKVRTVGVADGKAQPMFPNFYSQIAVDPASGTALVAVDQFVADCNDDKQQGLFLARPGTAPMLLDDRLGAAGQLGWSAEASLFYAFIGDGWLTFKPTGQPGPALAGVTDVPDFAPGGKDWAWLDKANSRLMVSLDGAAQAVSQDAASWPTWSPDGRTLLYFSGGQLWAGDPRAGPPAASPGPTITQNRLDVVEWAK